MLKKNQVDGHAARCRRCAAVSCVDCSVSFGGGTTLCVLLSRVRKMITADLESIRAVGASRKCFN
jgi:hypothetical protein